MCVSLEKILKYIAEVGSIDVKEIKLPLTYGDPFVLYRHSWIRVMCNIGDRPFNNLNSHNHKTEIVGANKITNLCTAQLFLRGYFRCRYFQHIEL